MRKRGRTVETSDEGWNCSRATRAHFHTFGMQIDKWQAQNKDKEQTKQDQENWTTLRGGFYR